MKFLPDSNIHELDLNTIVALYNGTLSDVLDKHVSLKQKKIVEAKEDTGPPHGLMGQQITQ